MLENHNLCFSEVCSTLKVGDMAYRKDDDEYRYYICPATKVLLFIRHEYGEEPRMARFYLEDLRAKDWVIIRREE